MNRGITIKELAEKIDEQVAMKEDYLVDTRNAHLTRPDHMVVDGPGEVALNTHAQRQLEGWAGIPAKYADAMREHLPQLYTSNVNGWLEQKAETRMLRTFHEADAYNGRAWLSNGYRRLDNENLARVLFPTIRDEPEIRVLSSQITESRMYLQLAFPRLQAEVAVGDPVQTGLVISNSEIGLGMIHVQPMVFRLVCTNGMIMQDKAYSKRHTGSRIQLLDDEISALLSDEAKRADDEALALKLRDVVKAAMTEAELQRHVSRLRQANDTPPAQNPIAATQLLGKTMGLREHEVSSITELLIQGRNYTKYGAANAVTAQAHRTDDYDRSVELEALGGKVIDLKASEWKTIVEAE